MSYPKDLEEYTDSSIEDEFQRRWKCIKAAKCYYCGYCTKPTRNDASVTYCRCKMVTIHGKSKMSKFMVNQLMINDFTLSPDEIKNILEYAQGE